MRIDYVLLALVCMFLVTNFFGLGFTLRRLRRREEERQRQHSRVTAAW